MYDQSVSSYLQNLNSFVQQQALQIQELERQLKEFQNEISTLKQQPPSTRIDRLEYKFDQLKIERLEGTLNIGFHPTDPNAVQNFEVGQTSPQVGMMQQEQAGQQMQQIRQNVDMYLNEEIPVLLEQLETQYESRLDETNKYHIIEDIRKQMDSRIKYYMSHVPKEENTAPAQYAEEIAEHVKRDIVRAVEHFIKHIPGEMKGDDPS
ncbi:MULTISPECIES: spore germination protein GerPC [Bacillus]|uniref:spore germination protein GerPC n=1 Tax=Bacillus TaxID=1386 RepID=UPI0007795A32|nr:spore germination protein GerPC [Bacillus amyloliquefaciens]MBW8279593.1 spore germination protein GerPC [Bacillus amyloliquefaciens]MEC1249437.1 spore germination protein GerPC [Bacillus amyloliquefaciens]MEC2251345.1 spore germination protein GerPC [Bacillus amyloliquefaciens]MED0829142.1 spore germination protein GerPC [Bacillus amyloliquefaciens]MED1579446.1 spore germination protein GerPC [Bacillus amyloliquefaciens]